MSARNLTTLVELRDLLCEERLGEIVRRASKRGEEEVKMLVASVRPQPEPTDLQRRLPTQAPIAETGPSGSGPNHVGSSASQPAPPLPPKLEQVQLAPVAEERYVVHAVVSKEFVDDLATVRALLSHKIPAGNLEQVLHECLRIAGVALAKNRRGSGKPARASAAPPATKRRTHYTPAPVRDEVWRRDDSRCAYVAPAGRRRNST